MPTNILEVPLCIPSVFPLWILCVTLCYSALESLPDLDEFLLLKP